MSGLKPTQAEFDRFWEHVEKKKRQKARDVFSEQVKNSVEGKKNG